MSSTSEPSTSAVHHSLCAVHRLLYHTSCIVRTNCPAHARNSPRDSLRIHCHPGLPDALICQVLVGQPANRRGTQASAWLGSAPDIFFFKRYAPPRNPPLSPPPAFSL